VTQAGRGTVAKRVLANYQMGLGRYQENERLRGKLGYTQSDINQRAFYQRWADLMAAESWRDLRHPGSALGEAARDGRRA
jgi:ethylbenzene dioxygenase subunit alpha